MNKLYKNINDILIEIKFLIDLKQKGKRNILKIYQNGQNKYNFF